MQLIMSVVGMAVLILIAVLISSNRRAINLRTVAGAFLIQVVIGAFVLYVPAGRDVFWRRQRHCLRKSGDFIYFWWTGV